MATKSTSSIGNNGGVDMRARVQPSSAEGTHDVQRNQKLSEGEPTLSTILSGFDDAALHIATYLPND